MSSSEGEFRVRCFKLLDDSQVSGLVLFKEEKSGWVTTHEAIRNPSVTFRKLKASLPVAVVHEFTIKKTLHNDGVHGRLQKRSYNFFHVRDVFI